MILIRFGVKVFFMMLIMVWDVFGVILDGLIMVLLFVVIVEISGLSERFIG